MPTKCKYSNLDLAVIIHESGNLTDCLLDLEPSAIADAAVRKQWTIARDAIVDIEERLGIS